MLAVLQLLKKYNLKVSHKMKVNHKMKIVLSFIKRFLIF